MNILRKWIRNVFGFSGVEVNGFIVLLPLTLLLVMAQPLYHFWLVSRSPDFTTEQKTLDSLATFWDGEHKEPEKTLFPLRFFDFDPNKASTDELQGLGFSEILSNRIANYRQKGGQFRVKSDLLKIYGLDSSFYRQLYAYIRLPDKLSRKYERKDSIPGYRKKQFLAVRFDVNKADTTQLKSIYGIGPVLASRIIRFREGLGGFITNEQLNEVYGLDSSVVERLLKTSFIADDFVPRKLDMNTASEKDLAAHPYINRSVANAIVTYRFQHGKFTDVEDIRKLASLLPKDIDRIVPYLTISN